MLFPDEQTIALAVAIRDFEERGGDSDLNIQINQGLTDEWMVGWTGSLFQIEGNSDGNTAAEVLWMGRRLEEDSRRPGYGGKFEIVLGSGGDDLPALEWTGIGSIPMGDTTLHGNATVSYQEQKGANLQDTRLLLTLGLSSSIGGWGESASLIGQMSYDRTLNTTFDNPWRVDFGLRVQPEEDWLWFVGAGTDLSQNNLDHERVRIVAGFEFDVS